MTTGGRPGRTGDRAMLPTFRVLGFRAQRFALPRNDNGLSSSPPYAGFTGAGGVQGVLAAGLDQAECRAPPSTWNCRAR